MGKDTSIKRGVSLYSYQEEYCFGKLSLEDCLAVTGKMGIEGVEIIGDQMIHGSPFPPDEFYEKWTAWLGTYNMTPVCSDIFINTNLYKNRNLTDRESIQALIAEIKHASRLGCRVIRLVSNTPAHIVGRCLPCAEKYDVALALEIHAGLGFDNPLTEKFIALMLKENSPHIGLVPDMGLFCRRYPRIVKEYYMRMGVKPELSEYLVSAYDNGEIKPMGFSPERRIEELARFNPTDIDKEFIIMMSGFENNDLNVLKEFMPYVKNVHAKFYEMTEDYLEYSIPYEEIIEFFDREGYDGFFCSEYEGNRFIQDAFEVDSVEQVRRHHVMMKKYIGS